MKHQWLLAAMLIARIDGVAQADAPGFVWWEAEEAVRTNFPPADGHGFVPAHETEAAVLSAGRWLGISGTYGEVKFIEYDVPVPDTGTWRLYVRKFWLHGPFRWRFDDQPWREVGRNVALLDGETLRTHLVANWVFADAVELKEGTRRLRIELLEGSGAAAFDAFVLTRQPFIPRGKLRPDEKHDRAPEGWFPFEPDLDRFAPSPIDLRGLNERYAGENGFIEVCGDAFVHGASRKPVRFWAVNAGAGIARMDDASVDHLARFLAKYGVNLVRYHGTIYEGSGANVGRIDPESVERLHYLVAALKREGIYTHLSIYFPLWVRLDEQHGWAGYTNQHPFALPYFSEPFQEMYRGWWRHLLTEMNPYTGLALADDPAVALLEIVNEDSYLFWTFTPYQNIPGPQMQILEREYGAWLAGKYGSIETALRRWGGERVRGDEPGDGRAGFVSIWEMANIRSRRAQDTATFLTEHQMRFYQEVHRFLKDELGFGGSVHASNWITADARVLGPLDKYSNTVADFMDRHGYYGGVHEGDGAAYSVRAGHTYRNRTALRFERQRPPEAGHGFGLPIDDIIYNGMPSTISEIDWPLPNRYRTEMPLLCAVYGALQGSDAFHFFSLSGPWWPATITSKWAVQTPVAMGQFPAMARIFRQGLVRSAQPVVEVDLNLDELKRLGGAPVVAPQNLDPIRAADIPEDGPARVDPVQGIDPRAFYVGRVQMNFVEGPGAIRAADLSGYIDDAAGRIRSATGELLWDYAVGLVTLDAPAAQGATGFFRDAGTVETHNLRIESDLEYGAIVVVALDGKPLARSDRMLLQVISENQNYGYHSELQDGVRRITSLGTTPIVVRNLSGTVRIIRPDAGSLQVTALDLNGYPGETFGSAESIHLREDVLYYLIER